MLTDGVTYDTIDLGSGREDAGSGVNGSGGQSQMPRKERRIDRLRQKTGNVSLEDFEAMINAYGHVEPGAKHPKAIIGVHTMPYKRENPVKVCYVKELIAIIDSLEGKD